MEVPVTPDAFRISPELTEWLQAFYLNNGFPSRSCTWEPLRSCTWESQSRAACTWESLRSKTSARTNCWWRLRTYDPQCYFVLNTLGQPNTISAALKPLGVLEQIPDAVESSYPYELIVGAAANDKCLCAFIIDLQILAERNRLPRDVFLRPPRNTPMWHVLAGDGITMPCPTGRRQFDMAANDRLPAMVRDMFDVSGVGHQLNLERTHVELKRALGIQQSIERSVSSSHRAAPILEAHWGAIIVVW